MTQLISDAGRVIMKDVLADIRLHPETHNQRKWICGTGACLAGKVVLTQGAAPAWNTGLASVFGISDEDRATSTVITADGRFAYVGTLSTEILGISEVTASILYSAENTIDELEIMFSLLDAGTPIAVRCDCREDCTSNAPSKALEDALRQAGLMEAGH